MKLLKKAAALMLAASLSLIPACGRNAGGPDPGLNPTTAPDSNPKVTAMGRYIEERWDLPAEAKAVPVLTLRPDGRVLIVISDAEINNIMSSIRAFSTSDGKDWREENIPRLQELTGSDIFFKDLAYGQNGECFAVYNMMKDGAYITCMDRIAQDGSVQEIDCEWQKASPFFLPFGLKVGGDGDLYIGQITGQVSRFGADGRFKVNVGGDGSPEFAYYDSQLAVIHYGSNTVTYGGSADSAGAFALYDTDTGGITKDIGFNLLRGGTEQRLAAGPDGALYVANASGVYRLAEDVTTWERMVDGDLCSLSMPSISLDKFVPHGDKEFLTLVKERGKPVLINYVYSTSTPTRPTTELTVAALKKNSTLFQAAGEFRRQNPDVVVTVQTMLEEDGSATVNDAIRALNTQILAGKGPDVLLLDGLPIDAYIEKGVLADMSDWLKPVIGRELLPNVAGALEEGGKLYAVPARFGMPTVWGAPEAVAAASSLESAVKYAEAHPGDRLLYAMHRKNLFPYFYKTSAPAWLSGKKLDEKAFADYLELIKRLSDTAPGEEEKDSTSYSILDWVLTGIDMDGLEYVSAGYAGLFSAELNGFDQMIMMNGMAAYMNGVAVTPENPGIGDSLIPSYVALLPGQASGVFIPRCILGVNAAGKQQELAGEFIKTALSEAVQYSDLADGLPVNRSAIEGNILRSDTKERAFSFTIESEIDGELDVEEVRVINMYWPTPGMRRAVCGLFDKLDTPYLPDDTLTEMILNETEGFFNGAMSAKDTAAAVAARLELYLAEQG